MNMVEATVNDESLKTIGDLYADLGSAVADLLGAGNHHVLLYSEAGPGWASVGLFQKDGNQIRYVAPDSEISDLILEIWRTEAPEKRWDAMEYELNGAIFNVRLAFKEDFVRGETDDDRNDAAVRRTLGDGPIIYPPWEH
jgi:hypothetical protein